MPEGTGSAGAIVSVGAGTVVAIDTLVGVAGAWVTVTVSGVEVTGTANCEYPQMVAAIRAATITPPSIQNRARKRRLGAVAGPDSRTASSFRRTRAGGSLTRFASEVNGWASV